MSLCYNIYDEERFIKKYIYMRERESKIRKQLHQNSTRVITELNSLKSNTAKMTQLVLMRNDSILL